MREFGAISREKRRLEDVSDKQGWIGLQLMLHQPELNLNPYMTHTYYHYLYYIIWILV